jgi:hypothetical protein
MAALSFSERPYAVLYVESCLKQATKHTLDLLDGNQKELPDTVITTCMSFYTKSYQKIKWNCRYICVKDCDKLELVVMRCLKQMPLVITHIESNNPHYECDAIQLRSHTQGRPDRAVTYFLGRFLPQLTNRTHAHLFEAAIALKSYDLIYCMFIARIEGEAQSSVEETWEYTFKWCKWALDAKMHNLVNRVCFFSEGFMDALADSVKIGDKKELVVVESLIDPRLAQLGPKPVDNSHRKRSSAVWVD